MLPRGSYEGILDYDQHQSDGLPVAIDSSSINTRLNRRDFLLKNRKVKALRDSDGASINVVRHCFDSVGNARVKCSLEISSLL